jgi:hypothetical protein
MIILACLVSNQGKERLFCMNLASSGSAALWVTFLFPAFVVSGLREGYQIPAGTILPAR